MLCFAKRSIIALTHPFGNKEYNSSFSKYVAVLLLKRLIIVKEWFVWTHETHMKDSGWICRLRSGTFAESLNTQEKGTFFSEGGKYI